ncbi:MAG: methyltransferase domain-containing protein [Parcubacteria group bacterium]|jgi:SAM-dependent methyltransferase
MIFQEIIGRFKSTAEKMFEKAVSFNFKNIIKLAELNSEARFVDLGCDDGNITLIIAKKIKTNDISGVEIADKKAKLAEERGVCVYKFDLNGAFDLQSNYFDVVHANQVIEHLTNSDNFLSEIYRILKPGGYAIISTENASSWCNVFSSLMGWQIFSLTNFSKKKSGIGNPFSLHAEMKLIDYWGHIRIYNIRGLKEYLEAYDFRVEDIAGAGYFPFPAWFGNIDKTHSHFMTFKIRK